MLVVLVVDNRQLLLRTFRCLKEGYYMLLQIAIFVSEYSYMMVVAGAHIVYRYGYAITIEHLLSMHISLVV